jgi:hypothetical protein
MPSARRRAALPRPEVVFLFLPLRPRDTGDMPPMLEPAHHGHRALAPTHGDRPHRHTDQNRTFPRATKIRALHRLAGHANSPSDTERIPTERGTQRQARYPIMLMSGSVSAQERVDRMRW